MKSEYYELRLPPVAKKKRPVKIDWTPEMIQKLIDSFPYTFNNRLAKDLGVSQRSLIRKARELGLEKEPDFFENHRGEMTQMAIAARRPNPTKGMKGWCVPGGEATQFKPGNIPAIKKDPMLVQRIREKRNNTIARERMRLRLGLDPLTKLKLKY
ncbi:hypothetical protein [Bacteroides sp. 51]|uniref:hypothetical protein n=1 Tax=Bacteroides sp. 51 TaxID=2302938 RepID=UPI0013D348ED|nr:hypothetical protein [Bacteroides sp. 51]NDV83413.1 hypothetical protein [Bacteroides sp. 51]